MTIAIANLRQLNFDYIGTQVGQHRARNRGCDPTRHVQYLQPIQQQLFGHDRSLNNRARIFY